MSVALQEDVDAVRARALRIALVGSPNTGKTTLFNALTGGRSRVGNYPGVTVERREGPVRDSDRGLRVLDLPGTYSLDADTPDEQVVVDVIEGRLAGEPTPDAIVLVADATTLERGLALVHEVLENALPRPCALAVTMIDELRARGGHVDFNKLERRLGIPVFPIVGHRGVGLDRLRRALERPEEWQRPTSLAEAHGPEGRFAWADALYREVQIIGPQRDKTTERIDRVLLHPVFGVLFFAAVMLFVFQSIFIWAVPAMDAIEGLFTSLGRLSRDVLPGGPLTDLWTDGILAGVGSVLVFLPQIAILFTLIHVLEDVGYMARAAFVVDRVMGWFGLQGRSFVVLLSCYACAVPGIMAARTIPNPRDRLATILVAPFMTCSARLPVYTLLIAAFVPARRVLGPVGLQGLVMLGLYILGAITAIVSAALLKATIVRGHTATFFMDLPPYRLPTARLLLSQVWGSVRSFLKRAGTIIFTAALIVWALLSFPQAPEQPNRSAEEQAQANVEASVAAHLGRALEPVIEPLGFDWRIGVGIISSLAAREIIVSSMAQIYAVSDPDDFTSLRDALREDTDPDTGQRTFGLPVALSLLVFFVFALQCTSTIAIMAKETGSWRWPVFAFTYMFVLAYCGAFVTYHLTSALLGA